MLTKLYSDYLCSKFATDVAKPLLDEFKKIGLNEEAIALQFYIDGAFNSEFHFEAGLYKGKACFIGFTPNEDCQPGDLWFDLCELSLAVLISDPELPDRKDLWMWCSLKPVYGWQFKAFKEVAIWAEYTNEEFMASARADEIRDDVPVSNIYRAEADAYCAWFRKRMTTVEYHAALSEIVQDRFGNVANYWDDVDDCSGAGVEFATSLNVDPDIDLDEIAERYSSGEELESEEKAVYGSWSLHKDVGFISAFRAERKYLDVPFPYETRYGVQLQNGIDRLSGKLFSP